MPEKRQNIRHSTICKVIYSVDTDPGRRFRAISFNISLSGVGLRIDRVLKCESKLHLLIYKEGSNIPVKAEGKLVWQKELSDGREYRAGVQFTEVAWTRLRQLVNGIY